MNDKTVELYRLLNTATGKVIRLKKVVASGPWDDVSDNFDNLVAALMSVRDTAAQIAELPEVDRDIWVSMCLLQDSVTKELLRLTNSEVVKSAAAGV